MINVLKDRYKFGLGLATLFFLGVIISAYQVYKLPHLLSLSDGFHPAMISVYGWLAITFIIGAGTIWITLNNRREIIVFREKEAAENRTTSDQSNGEKTTISLDTVRQSIASVADRKSIMDAGLHAICKELEAGQGAGYLVEETEGKRTAILRSGYALAISENNTVSYASGEGLIGQAIASGKTLYLDEVPEGYIKIISGLGSASPRFLLIVAVKRKDRVEAALEIASFTPISENQRKFVEESAELMAEKMQANQNH